MNVNRREFLRCADPQVDLVYICTPWSLHTPMAVEAMEQGKHAADLARRVGGHAFPNREEAP